MDEYIVTIFPGYDWKSLSAESKEVEFRHLVGGTTQGHMINDYLRC